MKTCPDNALEVCAVVFVCVFLFCHAGLAAGVSRPRARVIAQMVPIAGIIDAETKNWAYAVESIPSRGHLVDRNSVKGSQFSQPLLEFSGACEGCGETPYVKLLTQLVRRRHAPRTRGGVAVTLCACRSLASAC